MSKIKILYQFELYRGKKLVGIENHGIDPDTAPEIGIYHNELDSDLLMGNPVTLGDRYYIFHTRKVLVKKLNLKL